MIKYHCIDDDRFMSYIDISDNSVERYLCSAVWQKNVLFWTEYIDKEEQCSVLGKIRLNSSTWVDEWFDVLSKACSL
jgi:hypothetical protein